MKAKVFVALMGSLVVGSALADVSAVMNVSIQGPGGHSNGAYGRVNAVHAASRAILEIEKAVMSSQAVISDFNGGNSVNSIASDATFKLTVMGKKASDIETLKRKVELAIKEGVDAENRFRSVKPGDLTGGVPATVSYVIHQE